MMSIYVTWAILPATECSMRTKVHKIKLNKSIAIILLLEKLEHYTITIFPILKFKSKQISSSFSMNRQ